MAAVDERVPEVQKWLSDVLGKPVAGDLFEAIKDGVLLCELLNKIKPGTVKGFKVTKIAFVARSNIQIFLEGAKKIGVKETDLFESRDLYDGQRPKAVLDTLYRVSAASHTVAGFSGPFISVAYSEAAPRHFTKEQLAKSRSAIPAMSRGGIAHEEDRLDGHGIVRSAKLGLESHSGGQGVWDKGSVAVDSGDRVDGYGIVKAKGMESHSGAMGVWDSGLKKTDTSAKADGYGIVKVPGADMSHTGATGVWDSGLKKHDTGAKADGYGIVKVPGADMSHSGATGVWDSGSKAHESSSMDAYGIVKSTGS